MSYFFLFFFVIDQNYLSIKIKNKRCYTFGEKINDLALQVLGPVTDSKKG